MRRNKRAAKKVSMGGSFTPFYGLGVEGGKPNEKCAKKQTQCLRLLRV